MEQETLLKGVWKSYGMPDIVNARGLKMRIREAKPTDAPRLAEIHLRGWQFTYKNIIPNAYLSKLKIEDYPAK